MPTIETRQLTDEAIEMIEGLSANELENKFRNGDYLYLLGIAFTMVHYSMEDIDGQSKTVTWWSELYNVEIEVNRASNTVTVEKPVTDWKRMGF